MTSDRLAEIKDMLEHLYEIEEWFEGYADNLGKFLSIVEVSIEQFGADDYDDTERVLRKMYDGHEALFDWMQKADAITSMQDEMRRYIGQGDGHGGEQTLLRPADSA